MMHKATAEDFEQFLVQRSAHVNFQDTRQDHHVIDKVLNFSKYVNIQERAFSRDSKGDDLNDADLVNLEKQIKDYKLRINEKQYEHMKRAFKVLAANQDKNKYEVKSIGQYYLTEKSIVEHFAALFGYRCDPVAKLLYIKMAKGKDFAKIDFLKFARVLDPFLDEVPKKRNRAAFDLYDVKNEGKIDIMVLMQILNNVDRNTYFAQEVLILIREYKLKNVLLSAGFSRQITLNFATFNELISNNTPNASHTSFLCDEIQYILLGK